MSDHHAHHARMFRRRFFISLVLTVPVAINARLMMRADVRAG